MLDVKGIAVPLAFLNSIHGLMPNLMALLNVIVITLFIATFTVLFKGLLLVTTGGVLVIILTFAVAVCASTVVVTIEFPVLTAVKVVDTAPFIILATNGLTVPNVSLAKLTNIPSGT